MNYHDGPPSRELKDEMKRLVSDVLDSRLVEELSWEFHLEPPEMFREKPGAPLLEVPGQKPATDLIVRIRYR